MTFLNPRRVVAVAAIVAAGVSGPVALPATAGTITGSAVPQNRSVPLVTGDEVFLDESGKATVNAGQSRAKIRFVSHPAGLTLARTAGQEPPGGQRVSGSGGSGGDR
jgi:hypothetical protein